MGSKVGNPVGSSIFIKDGIELGNVVGIEVGKLLCIPNDNAVMYIKLINRLFFMILFSIIYYIYYYI